MSEFCMERNLRNRSCDSKMRKWLTCTRRDLFVCFSVMVLFVSLIIFVTEFIIQTEESQTGSVERCIPEENSPLSTFAKVNEKVFQRYCEIYEKYTENLESYGRYIYKPVGNFIDYGQPVKTFLPGNASNVKRILVWTSFYKNTSFIPKKLSCADDVTCDVTYEKADFLESDAIVIHGNNLLGTQYLPPERKPFQRWVYFIMESPYHCILRFHHFRNVFNFTATYRADSDVRATYFTRYPRARILSETEHRSVIAGILASKSRLVAGMISHCDETRTTRLDYIRQLNKTIPVDLYGSCGTLQCERNSKKCEDLMKTYKFYLAMENGNCRDYITEKAGYPLFNWESVPVVMGGADPGDYERFLPPGSYIHTSGFESPAALAEYLVMLDKNPTLYEQYHQWRRRYTGIVYNFDVWCQLCLKLYNTSMPVQTYRDMDGWYKQDVCKV